MSKSWPIGLSMICCPNAPLTLHPNTLLFLSLSVPHYPLSTSSILSPLNLCICCSISYECFSPKSFMAHFPHVLTQWHLLNLTLSSHLPPTPPTIPVLLSCFILFCVIFFDINILCISLELFPGIEVPNG